MNATGTPPVEASGAERRREQRYDVNLNGDLEIKVMFSGDGLCGVMFTHPAEHRDRLLKWLTQQMAEGKATERRSGS